VARKKKISVGGGQLKLGRAAMKLGSLVWNSPSSPLNLDDLERDKYKMQERFLDYFGIPRSAHDPKYFKHPDKRGITYDGGIKTRQDLSNLNKTIDINYLNVATEYISGSYTPEENINTATFQLSINLSGTKKTTRPLFYYLTADEISNTIDQDIGENLFKVSTMGDLSRSPMGPYYIQGTNLGPNNGQTGSFIIENQSDPTYISGEITGYDAQSDTTSFDILKFNKTGSREKSCTFFATGLDPYYKYQVIAEVKNKNVNSNNSFNFLYPYSAPQSGISGLSGTINWTNLNGIDGDLFRIYVNKHVPHCKFLYSGIDFRKRRKQIFCTGVQTGEKIYNISQKLFSTTSKPLKLNLSDSDYNQNYSHIGAPNYFTGNTQFGFNEIHITGNSSISGFFISSANILSTKACRKIDLSNNPNFKFFYGTPGAFDNLEYLNLSGCSLSSHNTGIQIYGKNRPALPGLPSGEFCNKLIADVAKTKLNYLNLANNDLNVTGIRGWVASCLLSSHVPGVGNSYLSRHSGYLNIKNQSDPSATLLTGSSDKTTQQVLSGIKILSGYGWVIDYDK